MIERNLAEWPLAEPPQAEPKEAQLEAPQQWNQEEQSFLNAPIEFESAERRIQKLLPGFNLKRLVF